MEFRAKISTLKDDRLCLIRSILTVVDNFILVTEFVSVAAVLITQSLQALLVYSTSISCQVYYKDCMQRSHTSLFVCQVVIVIYCDYPM